MKRIVFILAMIALQVSGAQFYYNSYTTNTDNAARENVTNVVNAQVSGQVMSNLSVMPVSVIENSGGLSTNNYSTYCDTNGAAEYWFGISTNYASTNIPPYFVLQSELDSATNILSVDLSSYADFTSLSNANKVYSNNPSGYVQATSISDLTHLGTNVVTEIKSGGGIDITTSTNSLGILCILSGTGTNNVSITNLNATTLAGYGAFTTVQSSWSNYVAAYNDYTKASQYTNNLLSKGDAAILYQPAGAYLTSSSNIDYLKVTNPPTIYPTNGFITIGELAPYAKTNWAYTNGFVSSGALTNYEAIVSFNASVSALASNQQVYTSSNELQLKITTNSYLAYGAWQTNQPFVSSVLPSTNINISLSTNSGKISATIAGSLSILGYQPSSANLTNWSQIPTNSILVTTNVVTTVTAGTGASIVQSTNPSGITVTIGCGTTIANPAPWGTVSFIPSNTSATNINWSTTLFTTPVKIMAYCAGAQISPTVLTATATGFTYQDSGTGTNKQVVVEGLCF